MPTTRNGRPAGNRTAAKTDARSPILPALYAADKPGSPPNSPDVEWYIRLDQRIHDDPDWSHLWVARRIGEPIETVKTQYADMVDALRGHPDRERGAALVWQLHDAMKARSADKTWRYLHPDNIGDAQRWFIHERIGSGLYMRSRGDLR